ncbi:MAG: hypothetical protein ACU0CY_00390 [Maritimibacter harenae]
MRAPLVFGLAALALVAGCSRSLTPNETVFARNLFGDTLETEEIEVLAGVGVLPLPVKDARPAASKGEAAQDPEPREPPEDLCVRKPNPRKYWRWPAAFVLGDDIYYSYRWYPHDAFMGLPERALYPDTVLMAHELVHVWQWQNRDRTNYSPLAAGNESIESRDPYWWESEGAQEFLSFGYEQQAAIVEDFVCYALFDPEDPKLDELADILRPVLPVDNFLKRSAR